METQVVTSLTNRCLS